MRKHLPFLSILLVVILLRLPGLFNEITGDEIPTVRHASAKTVSEVIKRVSTEEPHPPATFVFLHYWIKLGRIKAFKITFLGLFLLGILTLIVVCAKRLFEFAKDIIIACASGFCEKCEKDIRRKK